MVSQALWVGKTRNHRNIILSDSNTEESIRLNKFLSQFGGCSRRKADRFIEQGRVVVNGKKAVLGLKVLANDQVFLDSILIKPKRKKHTYLAFNKPEGIVCTTDTEKERNNIIDYINYPKRIFPIGRLDKNSQGLILLTDDGSLVNEILRAQHQIEKEYIVRVNKPITSEFITKMANGIPILNTTTQKCRIDQLSKIEFRIILKQGLNRQIRRMCHFLEYRITFLQRVRIHHIALEVPLGKYRKLTPVDIEPFFKKNR